MSEDKAGARLDRVLAAALPDISRTRLKALIAAERVVLSGGGTVCDPAAKVKAGERYTVSVPAAVPAAPEAQTIPLDIVYEDQDLVVIDKPAGLVVHPAAGHADGTLVNALLAHCGESLSGIGGVSRPGILHRLDKDTSGLLLVAKNDFAHHDLAKQLADHHIERAYTALVWGAPKPAKGEIDGNIGRSPTNRKKMAVVARGGKTALTRYRVVRRVGAAASLIECRLATGRTHQIRVHLTHIGHPIVGDPVYGRGPRRRPAIGEEARAYLAGFARQALHAHLIGFRHPRSGEMHRYYSELPKEFIELIDFLDGV
ncbi:MAG: RluA family pseudouridine synthase [Rhodospirillales bacterium]